MSSEAVQPTLRPRIFSWLVKKHYIEATQSYVDTYDLPFTCVRYIYLSIYLSIYRWIDLPIYLSIYLSILLNVMMLYHDPLHTLFSYYKHHIVCSSRAGASARSDPRRLGFSEGLLFGEAERWFGNAETAFGFRGISWTFISCKL